MKLIHSICALLFCLAAIAYGTENKNEQNREKDSIGDLEMCDQCPSCPRDKHPVGEDCPHQPS